MEHWQYEMVFADNDVNSKVIHVKNIVAVADLINWIWRIVILIEETLIILRGLTHYNNLKIQWERERHDFCNQKCWALFKGWVKHFIPYILNNG